MKTDMLNSLIEKHRNKGINNSYWQDCVIEAAEAEKELQELLNRIKELEDYIERMIRGEIE